MKKLQYIAKQKIRILKLLRTYQRRLLLVSLNFKIDFDRESVFRFILISRSVFFAFADLPIQTVFPLVFNTICFWMMNFGSDWTRFSISCLVALLVLIHTERSFMMIIETASLACFCSSAKMSRHLSSVDYQLVISLLIIIYYLFTPTNSLFHYYLFFIRSPTQPSLWVILEAQLPVRYEPTKTLP